MDAPHIESRFLPLAPGRVADLDACEERLFVAAVRWKVGRRRPANCVAELQDGRLGKGGKVHVHVVLRQLFWRHSTVRRTSISVPSQASSSATGVTTRR